MILGIDAVARERVELHDPSLDCCGAMKRE